LRFSTAPNLYPPTGYSAYKKFSIIPKDCLPENPDQHGIIAEMKARLTVCVFYYNTTTDEVELSKKLLLSTDCGPSAPTTRELSTAEIFT